MFYYDARKNLKSTFPFKLGAVLDILTTICIMTAIGVFYLTAQKQKNA